MPSLGAGFLHLWRCCLLLILGLTTPLTLALASPAPAWGAPAVIDLQQGWRPEEIDLYHHTSEGTNLAPLELALHLPDPRRPGHRFLEGFEGAIEVRIEGGQVHQAGRTEQVEELLPQAGDGGDERAGRAPGGLRTRQWLHRSLPLALSPFLTKILRKVLSSQ